MQLRALFRGQQQPPCPAAPLISCPACCARCALLLPAPAPQEREDWKLDTLCDLYETLAITQSVIFANTRRKVGAASGSGRQRRKSGQRAAAAGDLGSLVCCCGGVGMVRSLAQPQALHPTDCSHRAAPL